MAVLRNCLHYYVELLRVPKSDQYAANKCGTTNKALHNIIRTMRTARHDMICGEDFSSLDFGNIPLNGIHWSLDGNCPCVFDKSHLNEWNFMSGHSREVISIAWSNDCKYIITGSQDCTAIIWDAETGLMIRKFSGHTDSVESVAISPNNKYCITLSGKREPIAMLWDIDAEKAVKAFSSQDSYTNIALFTQNDNECIVGSSRGTAIIWNIEDEREVEKLDITSDYTLSIAYSSDGKHFILGKWNGVVELWNAKSNERIFAFEASNSPITAVAFSASGNSFFTCSFSQNVTIWSMTNGNKISTIPFLPKAFSPDGKYLITQALDLRTRIVDTKTKSVISILFSHDYISNVVFSPDGKHLLTSSRDQNVMIWNVNNGQCQKMLESHIKSIGAFSVNVSGTHCILGSDNDAVLWDLKKGTIVQKLRGHSRTIIDVAFSPVNSDYCVTSSLDSSTKVWDSITGEYIRTIHGFSTDITVSPKMQVCVLDDYSDFDFVSDRLDKALIHLRNACFINVETGECNNTIDVKPFESVSFSKDGNLCLICGGDAELFNTETGCVIMQFKHSNGLILAGALSPDLKCCLTCSDDNIARIWSVETGECIMMLNEHTNTIWYGAFSSDGDYCLTVSWDHSAKLWDAKTGKCIKTYYAPDKKSIMGEIKWNAPYCLIDNNGSCDLYRFDIFNPHGDSEPVYIDSFYNIDDIYLKKCSFSSISASEITKKIIHQNGAVIIPG